ncbi:MAG: hypothetical protein R2856_07770 [Caldilineaceae bacterium]
MPDAILRISSARPSYSQRIAIWSHFVDACDHEFDGGVDVEGATSQFTLDSTADRRRRQLGP